MRKERVRLTKGELEELRLTFYLHSEDELAKKFNVSKTSISVAISTFLRKHSTMTDFKVQRIRESVKIGCRINDLMTLYNLKFQQAQNFWLAFNDRSMVQREVAEKQPYWTSEDEMIIQKYSVDELEGWEAEILLSLV